MSERSIDDDLEYLKGQIAGLAFMCSLLLQVATGRLTFRRDNFESDVLATTAAWKGRSIFLDGFNQAIADVTLELLD